MRVGPGIRAIFFFIVLSMIGAGVYLFYLSTQVETAYVFAKDLDRYTFIENNSEDFLRRVTIPQHRDFEVITNPAEIVGKFTDQPVYSGQLIQGAMLIDELPDGRRLFPRGLLPEGTEAYPIAVPENIGAIFAESDLVNIYALLILNEVPSPEDIGILLFQKVTSLGVIDGNFVVALSPEQIMAYEGWQRREGVSFTASISQEANWDYPPLQAFVLYPDYNSDEGRALFARPTPQPENQE